MIIHAEHCWCCWCCCWPCWARHRSFAHGFCRRILLTCHGTRDMDSRSSYGRPSPCCTEWLHGWNEEACAGAYSCAGMHRAAGAGSLWESHGCPAQYCKSMCQCTLRSTTMMPSRSSTHRMSVASCITCGKAAPRVARGAARPRPHPDDVRFVARATGRAQPAAPHRHLLGCLVSFRITRHTSGMPMVTRPGCGD